MGHNEYIHPRYNNLGTFVALFVQTPSATNQHILHGSRTCSFYFSKYVTGADLALVCVFPDSSFHYACIHILTCRDHYNYTSIMPQNHQITVRNARFSITVPLYTCTEIMHPVVKDALT